MDLYHGTVIGGLDVILANSKSHKDGSKVAYFTTDRVYALVCCRPKTENFVTMGLREDKKQHYYERFPNQLRVMHERRERWQCYHSSLRRNFSRREANDS